VPTPADLPLLDLSRTRLRGCNVDFYGPDGKPVATVRSHSYLGDDGDVMTWVTPWDDRSVAALYLDRRIVELLPDGRAIAWVAVGQVVETGEDYSMLLDLAIAAGLGVEGG
jgi:hypothetical protein